MMRIPALTVLHGENPGMEEENKTSCQASLDYTETLSQNKDEVRKGGKGDEVGGGGCITSESEIKIKGQNYS